MFSAVPTSSSSPEPDAWNRAVRSPWASLRAVPASAPTGRSAALPMRWATSTARISNATASRMSVSSAWGTPRSSIAAETSVRTTARPPCVSTGTSTSRPSPVSAVRARPERATVMLSDRASGGPIVVPSGSHTVVRVPPRLLWSTTSRIRASGTTPTTAAMFCASLIPAVIARSTAVSRTRTVSGIRNATSTTDVVATTKAVNRRRIARPYSGSGSTSFRPTPRMLCRYRGAEARSPSLRRNHDRCTSTVLSLPP